MISRKKRDITPLIMWLILFAGLIVLAFIRLNRSFGVLHKYPAHFDTIFISLYLLWMIIELRVSKKDVNTEDKQSSDFATCQLYGLGQALIICTALWFPSIWRVPNVAHLVGSIFFLLGICYRLWAIRTLGQFYSHRVRTAAQHKIVISGPYRFTRHPAYAGMIIANAGVSLYFMNWVTTSVFLFLLVPSILLRIVIEEKMLFRIEGYPEFAKNRKRLIPAVW